MVAAPKLMPSRNGLKFSESALHLSSPWNRRRETNLDGLAHSAQLLAVFLVDMILGIEPLQLSADLDFQSAWIEGSDSTHGALAGKNPLPCSFSPQADGSDKPNDPVITVRRGDVAIERNRRRWIREPPDRNKCPGACQG